MSPILGSLGAAAVRGFRALGAAFSNFTDNFNRTTSGSLGTSSGGTGTWLATKGTWNADGTKATSADAASNYPLASVEMGTPNITVNVDVDATNSNGSGAAFWVSDSANWWGVVPWQATSVTYSQACSTYGQSGASYTCNAYGQSGPSYFCNAYGQSGPSYTCGAYGQTGPNYSCGGGVQYFFTYCTFGQVTNYGAVCNAYTTLFQCTSYSLGYDGFRGFYYSICNAYANVQNCSTYGSGVTGYSCSGGSTSQGSGYICQVQNGPFYGQVCNSQNGPFYGQTCTSSSGPFYGQVCNSSSGPFYSAVCNAYFSQTNNNPGTKYLRLIKSVANTVTTVVDQTVAATVASIKVIVSNGTITGRAYSGTGQTTQTGSDLTNTPVSPTTGTKHGIILAPGGYTQGNTVDNLSIILP